MESSSIESPAMRYRVLLVEDQTSIREMLSVLISALPDFEIVGQAGDIETAARLADELRPDVVLLDWMFPTGNGGAFLSRLTAGAQRAQILVFSATQSAHAVREALMGGAKGFVEKGASIAILTDALRTVARGHVYFGPTVARTVEALLQTTIAQDDRILSDREREVLCLVAEGLPSKEIAGRLGISLKTVGNHRAAIATKTGLHSIAQLTMHAARIGLVPGPNDLPEPVEIEHQG
jgi:DNA-binding NarL/FixJ family response regulator